MLAIGATTTAIETAQISSDLFFPFILARSFLIGLGLYSAFLLRKDPYSGKGHLLFGVSLIAYSSHGQWHRPFYEYTYFQAMIFYALLLYPPKKIFVLLQCLGAIVFTAVYTYRFEEVVLNSKTTLAENYFGLFAFFFTLFCVFKVFSEERLLKEQVLERFGLLGKHSATILHDLKSTIATPAVYLNAANEAFAAGNVSKAKARMDDCLRSLDSMQTVVLRLNQMGSLTYFSSGDLSLREILNEVLDALHSKIGNIRVDISGDLQVEANRSFLFSLILNILLNSIENFGRKSIVDPSITISMKDHRLVIEDNGGGFPPEILAKIKSGISASSKTQASGLGLFLLREGVRGIGAKISFSNSPTGAVVEVHFKG